MFAGKALSCECGYQLEGRAEDEQVAEIRRHAWKAHGIVFSAEDALGLLLRSGLELGEIEPADAAVAADHEQAIRGDG